MALPPGYLALCEAAAHSDRLAGFTREDAIFIEDYLRYYGWEIVPAWMVDRSRRPAGVVIEDVSS